MRRLVRHTMVGIAAPPRLGRGRRVRMLSPQVLRRTSPFDPPARTHTETRKPTSHLRPADLNHPKGAERWAPHVPKLWLPGRVQ